MDLFDLCTSFDVDIRLNYCVIKDHARASCSCLLVLAHALLILISAIMWKLKSCEKNTEKVVPCSKYSKLIFKFIHYFILYFNSNQNYFFGSHLLKNVHSIKQSKAKLG